MLQGADFRQISLYFSLLQGIWRGDRFDMDCVASQPVRSLWATSVFWKNAQHFGPLGASWLVSATEKSVTSDDGLRISRVSLQPRIFNFRSRSMEIRFASAETGSTLPIRPTRLKPNATGTNANATCCSTVRGSAAR
jgi:hypothetical protein